VRLFFHCWITIAASALSFAADNFKPEPGFISLFNGRDLTGWSYSSAEKFDGKTAASDGRFSARDGVLIVHPKEPRLAQKIWTVREFPRISC
jgi:hypothetical protein